MREHVILSVWSYNLLYDHIIYCNVNVMLSTYIASKTHTLLSVGMLWMMSPSPSPLPPKCRTSATSSTSCLRLKMVMEHRIIYTNKNFIWNPSDFPFWTVFQLGCLVHFDPTASHSKVDFDFLIRGQFLRTSLSSHMDTEGISTVQPSASLHGSVAFLTLNICSE